jgi:hypothetical protein
MTSSQGVPATGHPLAEIESPEVDALLVSQQQLDEQEAAFDTRQAAVEAAQATVQSLATSRPTSEWSLPSRAP